MSVTKRAGCVFGWQRRAFFSLHLSPSLQRRSPLHPINLNTATSAELQQVPGIGPFTADKILKTRKSYGPFKNADDLRAIKGIGPKRIEKMRKYLTVGRPPVQRRPSGPAAERRAAPSPVIRRRRKAHTNPRVTQEIEQAYSN